MEILLVSNQQVNLSTFSDQIRNHDNLRCVTVQVSPLLNGLNEAFLNVYQRLRLCNITGNGIENRDWKLQIYVGLSEAEALESGIACYNGYLIIEDVCRFGILERMNRNLDGRLKIKAKLLDVRFAQHQFKLGRLPPPFKLSIGETSVALLQTGTFGCEQTLPDVQNCDDSCSPWKRSKFACGASLSITAIIPEDFIFIEDSSICDKLNITRKLLNMEVACDVTIIPDNGVGVKCHKSFLAAHSPVFESMFQGELKESQTNTVEIPDMTEASVRAFLAYLYYWETKAATKDSLICFELLYAGHKYDVPTLEICTKKLILAQENTWFDVDVAMRLFLFARNLENGTVLKMKAIRVLKSKFAILEQSDSYKQLFRKDPEGAMDLCKYSFSI